MNLDQAEQSYLNDASFRQIVDAMQVWITGMNVTPAEVRAAAMLACIKVENRRVRPHAVPWGNEDVKSSSEGR